LLAKGFLLLNIFSEQPTYLDHGWGVLTTFFIYLKGAILIGPISNYLEHWGMPLVEAHLWTPSFKVETNSLSYLSGNIHGS